MGSVSGYVYPNNRLNSTISHQAGFADAKLHNNQNCRPIIEGGDFTFGLVPSQSFYRRQQDIFIDLPTGIILLPTLLQSNY